MKKVIVLSAALFMLAACGEANKKATGDVITTEDVKKFVEETSSDAADFSAEQWSKLEKEYEALLEKAENAGDKLSAEEKEAIENMKELFEAKKAAAQEQLEALKDSGSQAVDGIKENIENEVNDQLDKAEKVVAEEVDKAKEAAAQKIEAAKKAGEDKVNEAVTAGDKKMDEAKAAASKKLNEAGKKLLN